MSNAKSLWLGWTVLLVNGFHLVAGVVYGEVGGFGSLVNPDRLPSLDYEPHWYVVILAIHLALTVVGLAMVLNARSASRESPR